MSDPKMCLGVTADKDKKCKNAVGTEREENGYLTCHTHADQEPIAQLFDGDPDNVKAVVTHNKNIRREIERLEALRPSNMRNSSRLKDTLNSAGTEKDVALEDFAEDINSQDFRRLYSKNFRTAAFEAVTKNFEKVGLIVTPFFALVTAAFVSLFYLFLGFGLHPVAVESKGISTIAIGMLAVGFIFLSFAWLKLRRKDKRRLRLYQDRYSKLKALHEALEPVEDDASYEQAVSDLLQAIYRGENVASVTGLISHLDGSEQQAKVSLRSRVRRLLGWDIQPSDTTVLETSDQPTETNDCAPMIDGAEGEYDLDAMRARDIANLPSLTSEQKLRYLALRRKLYRAAEEKILKLKKLARQEEEVISVHAQVVEDNNRLKQVQDGNAWFSASMGSTPFILSFCVIFGVAFLAAWRVFLAASNPAHCDSQSVWVPKCFHLEISRSSAGINATKMFEKVLFHGQIGDKVLFSAPFEGPQDEDNSTWFNRDVRRHMLPVASVISMQTYKKGEEITRLGSDTVNLPPAPVYNLAQDNSFTTINARADATGGSGGEPRWVTEVKTRNEFPVQYSEEISLEVTNNFETEAIILPAPQDVLISNFILDGRVMPVPDGDAKRHILVPFFHRLIQARSEQTADMLPFYQKIGGKGIDTRLEAFIVGYRSLSLPDYPTDGTPDEASTHPRNFLDNVGTILRACTGSQTAPNDRFEISVAGYASSLPFKDLDGKRRENSDLLNHALAEGRRAAVLGRLLNERSETTSKVAEARIVLTGRRSWPAVNDDTGLIKAFLDVLSTDNMEEIERFATQVDPDDFFDKMKPSLRFQTYEEMALHLGAWTKAANEVQIDETPGGEMTISPVQEAFQRSAVISIDNKQFQQCGRNHRVQHTAQQVAE